MTERTDPVWRDGRLINPSVSGMICIHGVGLTLGMWCGGCIEADAPGPATDPPVEYFPPIVARVVDEETAQRLHEQFTSGRGDAGMALPPDSGIRFGIVEELRFVPGTLATYAGDRAGPLTHPIVELGSVLRAQLGHPERIRIRIEAAE